MDPNKRIGGPGLLAVILGSIVVFVLCLGDSVVAQVPFLIAFGWPSYLNRVVPQLRPDPWVVGTAIMCLVGLTLGGHAFLKWLYSATATEPSVWKPKWTACVVGLVVLTFTAGISVIGMIHQTSWIVRSPEPIFSSSREPMARMVSKNNLKQMGAAHWDRFDNSQRFPQAQFDAQGRAMHSWQTQLLPYLEQQNVYSQIDLTKPWNDPANVEPMRTLVKPYWNPLANSPPEFTGVSHYAGNVHVLISDKPRGAGSFMAHTILAGEVPGNFKAWGDPMNVRDPREFGGPNGRRPLILMLDGSVQTFEPAEFEDWLKIQP